MTARIDRRTGWWPRSARDGDLHYGTITDDGTVSCERCGAVFEPQPPPLVGATLSAQLQPADPEHPCRPTR